VTDRRLLIAASVAAGVLGLVALLGGTNLSVVIPAAMLAILSATIAGVALLLGRVRFPPPAPLSAEFETSLPLWESFRSGQLGRQTVIATLRQLSREMLGPGAAELSEGQEQALLMMGPAEFRDWADQAMSRLEASS
jgi:hypothetical protein